MNAQTKIYVAVGFAGAIFVSLLVGSIVSSHKIGNLERAVDDAQATAKLSEKTAEKRQAEAAAYKEKIDYLELKLNEIRQLARKQDEQLEKHNNHSRDARAHVDHARRTRAINTTAAELCHKLAELGHPCK